MKPDSQLPKSDELYLKIVETSQNEKEDNLQEPTVQESLLNVKNEQNASILSKKGVFRQVKKYVLIHPLNAINSTTNQFSV